MINVLSFERNHTDDGVVSFTPCIDRVSLADLVTAFEKAQGYTDPAGGYGGIVPAHSDLGSIANNFSGQGEPTGNCEQGQIYALFCECGEAGCWPLVMHIEQDDDHVIWRDFNQPHRQNRDYATFGPFKFNRAQYESTLAEITSSKAPD
jgi:hypothetical protein